MAMEIKMQCLIDNGTWLLVDLPKDCKLIKCKWLYIVKCDTQGNVTHHRARLVTKSFSQTEGIDYEQTFAPVAWLDSLHLLLVIAAYFDF